LPFVVGFDQDGAGQAEQRGGVGEDPDDVGASLDLLVEPLERVGDQTFFQCATGKSVKASSSSRASRSIVSTAGNCRPSMVAMTSSWLRTCSASGWANTVRIAAATISLLPLGTRASTLRMKWTRQRCQAAPSSTASIAPSGRRARR
jgi:hypothetical protein